MKNWVFGAVRKLAVLLFLSSTSLAVKAQQDKLMTILKEELDREFEALQKTEWPPYYMHYRVNEMQYAGISSSFGSLINSYEDKTRVLTVSVKVGDYDVDDSHETEEGGWQPGWGAPAILTFEDEPDAIRQAAWRATGERYRSAVEAYKQVRNEREDKKNKATEIADFSKEEPSHYYEPPLKNFHDVFNKREWEERVTSYSKLFVNHPDIISGDVVLTFLSERKYFISTEGSSVTQNATFAYLYISGVIRADDGDVVPLYRTYFVSTPVELPTSERIMDDVNEMIDKLQQLKTAPLAEPYTGPAILYARAAGVFFHEIFGHRVEGHRLRSELDGQTFKSKVKEQVLPKTLSVFFDPTMLNYEGQELVGAYHYDDEGVKGQRVSVVESGLLKDFLMSRTPLENFPNSNGHGRASAGMEAVSRQSNLIVETAKPMSMDNLRKMLIKECKKQGKKYGYLFKDVMGGFTNTDRYSANVFNIIPTEVYRIYIDGRPDELVRGVDLIGTPLTMFAEIAAAGDKKEVFTGMCGAESGGVPVSAVSPALFVRRIETQKKLKQDIEPALLSRPASVE